MAAYKIQSKDITNGAWQNEGVYILGNKENKFITEIDIVSNNYGESFYGTVVYSGENPKKFKARLDKDNMYRVQIKEDDSLSSWRSDGIWVIGNKENVRCTKFNISSDNEKIFTGVIKYGGEEIVEIQGEYIASYLVQNHWGKDTASWHFGGVWILGEYDKRVQFINIDSKDLGEELYGIIQYSDEDVISFKGIRTVGNNYEVYTKSVCGNDPWRRRQDMIIGSRDNQRVVKLKFNSNDNGISINGIMAYESEEEIKFRAALVNC